MALARDGQLQPVHYRQDLLRDLLNLLSLARDRHVLLVGPAGVGKRSLVHSLALLIAEGQGPQGIESVIEIAEPALLADAARAIKAGRRKARSGVLFVPNMHRFFGGVLHAVQDRAITLYNGGGNIRWRLPWPWQEGAFVADLALDAQGRIHVLAGREGSDQFYAYSLDRNTGQVIRWSVMPGTSATFVIDRLGEIEPDIVENWIEQ